MTKTSRTQCKLEFKQEAVRLVEAGQNIAAAARTLGVVEQTLYNWVKTQRLGELTGLNSKPVSAPQMEISRLRAELASWVQLRALESLPKPCCAWPRSARL